jgi:hypothetical protein
MTSAGAEAVIRVFDGTRSRYSDAADLLITAMDGTHRIVHREYHDASEIRLEVRTWDNFRDNYTFVASASGHKQMGIQGVPVKRSMASYVNLILIPSSSSYNFGRARWADVLAQKPDTAAILASGAGSQQAAAARYTDLFENNGNAAACLLNITTAMEQVFLPEGTALSYLTSVEWNQRGSRAMKQDRFYAWARIGLVEQLERASEEGLFMSAPAVLHPGATRSFKQKEFDQANVQFTLHENDRSEDNILVELDVDYYRDPAAHLLLEVLVNKFGSITDPKTVYAMRWVAGLKAGRPAFNPLYTIEKA